jgi:hypothetical protein
MNFKEASKKLDEIAKDKYHMLSYELITDRNKTKRQLCTLYYDPGGPFNGIMVNSATWDGAFVILCEKLNAGRPVGKIEDIPELGE